MTAGEPAAQSDGTAPRLRTADRGADHRRRLVALFGALLNTEGHPALRAIASLAAVEFAERRRELNDRRVFAGRVSRVIDGDTVEAESAGGDVQRIRLFGLDAPEDGQPGTEGAARFVAERALGRAVQVHGLEVDVYQRLVAVLTLSDGRVLNHDIVGHGWGLWYSYFAPVDDVLRDLESIARARRAGIWARPGAVEPWRWRRRGRGNRENNRAARDGARA